MVCQWFSIYLYVSAPMALVYTSNKHHPNCIGECSPSDSGLRSHVFPLLAPIVTDLFRPRGEQGCGCPLLSF